MPHGDFLKHRDLIANLRISTVKEPYPNAPPQRNATYHMLPPSHEPLVYDLRSIVSTGVDVYAFLYHRV